MASFAALNETFENISTFNIVVGTMDFQMLPGKTTESLPHQATSVTIEAQKFGLVDLYDPNPFYEHVTHLILKLEEFDIRTLSMLTTLECLKDLSLVLVKLSDGSFSLNHPELAENEELQPAAHTLNDDNLILRDSYPPSEIDDSDYSADFDGTFETLEVLRVTYPTRMHQFIVWIATQSPYLHTLIANESLHPVTEKICLAQAPSLSIHNH
ncbi:hypothetical protein DSO57_1032630 [Entomophthora muscae]|uniref:Uncharacterized protein n=1 Tax=Entomophthora muscae TaxID=34485 RepID=A0ACC2T0J0_9FUNG|nr:hypothetical protein DSO57_1032630 [Entomophthora muscae]